MANDPPAQPRRLSRAAILKRAGVLGAAASVPLQLATGATAAPELHAVETLTATEFETLSAITGRLVPTDASGPGALEAKAATYIDKALKAHYSYQQETYTANLAAVDTYSSATFGAAFSALTPERQDQVLTAMERGTARGFSPDSTTFFNLVLSHTQEGMFGDPYYGGNASFVGWNLLDYPGVKLEVTAAEQRLNVSVRRTRRSAYSYDIFKGKAG